MSLAGPRFAAPSRACWIPAHAAAAPVRRSRLLRKTARGRSFAGSASVRSNVCVAAEGRTINPNPREMERCHRLTLDNKMPIPIITQPMRIGNSRVTATEVARRAGVSQPTVSLVLSRNPKARVAAETRARVIKVAQELGYRPNRLAQGLVRRRSYALGVIVPGL